MTNKSVSLFEVLPPGGAPDDPKKKGQKSAAPKTGPATPAAQDSGPRKRISIDPDAGQTTPISKPAPAPAASAQPEPKGRIRSNEVEGVSVRGKNDHFPLILMCMLAFCIIIGLLAYRVGNRRGFSEGFNAGRLYTESGVPSRPPVATQSKPAQPTPPAVSLLPTSIQTPSVEQVRAVEPPRPPRLYTLQVQTMGRNQSQTTRELVGALRQSGFEAFADTREGVVFVGRLTSSRSEEAAALKKSISRFNWRRRDFSSAYFRRIPKHLVEN